MLDIKPYEGKVSKICNELHLKKLDLFGSATNDNFGAGSDIDIIVEFAQKENDNLFDRYFELKERLRNVFHRSVDIIIEGSVRNPFLKESLNRTRKNIYVA
ncbi:MAG: nucleotidyltransferase domain-containing protein [bacterium]|nr:nucleotidyltransferase domain-containing protein [bacterium]